MQIARANMSLVVGQASRLSPWLKPSQQKDAEAPWNGLGAPCAPRLEAVAYDQQLPSPKGWEIPAQGIALGNGRGETHSPERAEYPHRRAKLRRPYRAYTRRAT